MLFPFSKYIAPTWYFNLPAKGGAYFPDYDLLKESEKLFLAWDEGYSCREISKKDVAFQAWNKGFILTEITKEPCLSNLEPSLEDNYRFIRKYFHPLWSCYVLLLRLITFHNPLRELVAFIKQAGTHRIGLYDCIFPHEEDYKKFDSLLIRQAPKVSVIIPTLNRYEYLSDALQDLELQDYPNFEVIVVDQSEPFDPDFYESFNLNLKVIRQEEKALWLARNTAINASDAEYLLLYDDDSRVDPDWISHHLKCLDYFQADISSGVSISKVGAKVPENYRFFRWGDQLDTGNAMVKREVFRQVGLFDRQFERQRMGDGEFGMRAYLVGFKNISNPYAKRLHLKVAEGGLRQMGSWDAFRPKNWLAPRPVPSVNYFVRKYFGDKAAVLNLLVNVPLSIVPYRFKRNNGMLMIGAIIAVITSPFWLIQVIRSWHISSRMLRQGALIDEL